MEADDETILLAKTTDDRYADLEARVAEWHPHDVPRIERIGVADGHDPFAAWVAESVDAGE
ncbi:divalent-cation tolerance protein CutA [Haloplanus salinarum]|uniref:divalent-cation tolerance protein CutA n=1 Tax=Haloplanus salinarum TaxID=1912324 RepID=UPI00214C009E|nr:divalent-cation tolerance protein CutA [Haloplanus salinarum]